MWIGESIETVELKPSRVDRAHEQPVEGIDHEPHGCAELARAIAETANRGELDTLAVEHLDIAVEGVGNIEPPQRVCCQPRDAAKLAAKEGWFLLPKQRLKLPSRSKTLTLSLF